jgi:3-oxoacid CoA-transferase subunit B
VTGTKVVDRIITNLGVFDVVDGGIKVVELAEGVTMADVEAATEAKLVS